MPRIQLPPGCAGFADGDVKYMAERGPGSFVHIEDERQLKKLANQDYASAGLVDAGPEKFFVKKSPPGMWCRECNTLWHSWTRECGRCHVRTTSELEMDHSLPEKYQP
jgi:hypothetical protein